MRAMILAAGLGTRLHPLTDTRPKALVEVGGRTMLELTLARLRSFGVQDVIINVHHFADLVIEFLRRNRNFGMNIEISGEQVLLDTGGGLKKAAHFFLHDGNGSDEPFILHNVDILSDIDLNSMVEYHRKNNALATLAVQQRETSRYLIFDDDLRLCGRRAGRDCEPEMVRRPEHTQPLAFCGIHVISSRMLPMIAEDGIFSIIPSYLNLASRDQRILAFRAEGAYWRDLGRPESVAQAAEDLAQGVISL